MKRKKKKKLEDRLRELTRYKPNSHDPGEMIHQSYGQYVKISEVMAVVEEQ